MTLRQLRPPTVTAGIVASRAPIAAPSVGVNSERPTKKSPFMPMKTIRKIANTGQVASTCCRRGWVGGLRNEQQVDADGEKESDHGDSGRDEGRQEELGDILLGQDGIDDERD